MNRKSLVSLVLAAGMAMAMTAPAHAADLTNLSGQHCDGGGTWHFVNNQTGGASLSGLLNVCFDPAPCGTAIPASAINRNTQHFYVTTTASATLVGASTDLPGRLQLSDYTCEEVCVPEKGGEVCDGRDNDCDGQIDEDGVCACVPDSKSEICGDGRDNDCDGVIDNPEICNKK